MRFLSILRLRLVIARFFRAILGGITIGDRVAAGVDGRLVHAHAVGTHVSDRARFVERLRAPHRVAGREAELARRLLLQGRGGERRRGVALDRLGLDPLDRKAPVLDRLLGSHGRALVAQRHLVELFAVERYQTRGEGRAILLEIGDDRPVFLGLERLDLTLAVDDNAQRDRLDAAGRLGTGQLAPQHGRKREAEQVIERAAREIGVDQILVERARLLHRLGHRALGDRVEGHPVDIGRQCLALLEHVQHVPADRLTFAVRVSR